MSFRRYIAANSRDALAQVRRELGHDAVILSNRRVPEGFEVVAAAAQAMERIVQAAPATHVRGRALPAAAAAQETVQKQGSVQKQGPAQKQSAAQPTIRPDESFQEFVRRQSQAKAATPVDQSAKSPGRTTPASAPEPRVEMTPAPTSAAHYREVAQTSMADKVDETEDDVWQPTTFHMPLSAALSTPPAASAVIAAQSAALRGASGRLPTRWAGASAATQSAAQATTPAAPPAVFRRRAEPAAAPSVPFATVEPVVPPQTQVLEELQAMRHQLQQQLASLSSTVAASRQQLHSQITQSLTQISAQAQHDKQDLAARVMSRLLTAGFSPEVARKLAQHVPTHITLAEAQTWVHDVIALNLKVVAEPEGIVEAGGAYALVGPTGVGKTTTVAKLAARFAVKYGSGALGLITLDAYRVGAHEQLRAYGRILGAPVHLAQDSATLRELLVSMQNKRLVLIDSCGLSQRDDRLNEWLTLLTTANEGVPEAMRIQRVLLANAASHAETLDEAARAWRAAECSGCILTKLDEAVRMGGALDTALRYKLRLMGVTNGQRVPEDWHSAHARVLTHLALRPGADSFAMDGAEALVVANESAARTSTTTVDQ